MIYGKHINFHIIVNNFITLINDVIWRMSSVNNLAHAINLSKASSEYSHSVFESLFKMFAFQPMLSKAFVE